MEWIPLYVRAGAVLPMWPEAPASAGGHQPAEVELHVFVPHADAVHTSLLVEDDGSTFAAQSGGCYRTELTLRRDGGTVRLTASVEGDGYPEFARRAFQDVVHGASPAVLHVDGVDVAVRDGRFALPNEGTGFDARFDL